MSNTNLIDDWARFMRAAGHSPNTITIRTRTMRRLVRQAGVVDPRDLAPLDAVRFLGRDLSPWSRRTYWAAMDAWCRWLRAMRLQGSDLLDAVPTPESPDPVARPIDQLTIGRLLAAPLKDRARAYVLLALYQGLRVHEIAKVRGEDFADGYLTVTGKGRRTKPIPVHPEVARLADAMPATGWWFPSPSKPGVPVTAHTVTLSIGRSLRSVGSRATAHQLRDTAATLMQRQQGDLTVTARFLRHKSVRTTQKYVEVAADDLRAAVEAMSWGAAA